MRGNLTAPLKLDVGGFGAHRQCRYEGPIRHWVQGGKREERRRQHTRGNGTNGRPAWAWSSRGPSKVGNSRSAPVRPYLLMDCAQGF